MKNKEENNGISHETKDLTIKNRFSILDVDIVEEEVAENESISIFGSLKIPKLFESYEEFHISN